MKNNQSGNVLIFILIAIVLIGLLTTVLTRSSNTSNETGDYEQRQIIASQALRYVKEIETTIQSLKAQGCGENQLSFENSKEAGYSNANAPVDNSCHIFEPQGGGMVWEDPPQNITAQPWAIYGDHAVHGIGSTDSPLINRNADLIMVMRDIPSFICNAINLQLRLGLASPPTDQGSSISDGTEVKFQGTYAGNESITGANNADFCPDDSTTPLCYKNSGCYEEGGNAGYYVFYHVLLGR